MASTYSSLKVELIGLGEQDGTWGTTTNVNLGTTLEEAIVGRANPVMGNSDLTLTLANTNASQVARHYILTVTSTVPLTTTRNLIVPSIDKPYIVHNDTSGGQNIVVKTSAGTGITIPSGKTVMVYANGTDVVSAFDYVPTLEVGTIVGTIPVVNGGTGATTESGARTNLGLGTIATQNSNNVSITGGSVTGITDIAIADGGTGASTADNARTNLGVVIGTDVQAFSSNLTAFAGKTAPAGVVVGTTDTQTLTNKTITTPSISGGVQSGVTLVNPTVTDYTETLVSITGNASITLSSGTVFKVTTNGNNTITLPSSVVGKSYVVIVAYGGTHTVTWAGGSTIKWNNGTAPTQTSVGGRFDIFTFFCDGTNTYGSLFGRNF